MSPYFTTLFGESRLTIRLAVPLIVGQLGQMLISVSDTLMLGWLGVFLTGSDTSANALFGNLQVVTANQLGLDPAMMAAANSAGGVMGKMISLQSLAVAVAATGMSRSQESELLRFTFKHSIFLASLLGVLSMIYAYTF